MQEKKFFFFLTLFEKISTNETKKSVFKIKKSNNR